MLVVPPEAVRRVGQLDEVDVVEDGTPSAAGPCSSAGRSPKAARCSPGSRQGEQRRLCREPAAEPGEAVMSQSRHAAATAPRPSARLPERDRPRFLDNNFSIILIVVSVLIGLAALLVTAREEDPQIVVPLADVMVSMPGLLGRTGRAARGHAAREDPLSDRRRRICLQHGAREPGRHHGPVLRRPGPRAEPGQALQEDRREPGHRSARA